MATTNSSGTFLAALKALHEGVTKELPPEITQVTAGGKTSDVPTLATEIQRMVTVFANVETTHNAHIKALQVRTEEGPGVVTRYEDIASALKAALGKKNPLLAKFGLAPNKTAAPPTTEQKTLRIQKARATRVARGTKGKRQKEAIKGTVPATTTSAAPATGSVVTTTGVVKPGA